MLIDVPSAPRFLVDVFSFVVLAEFEVGVLTTGEFRWKIFLGEDCSQCDSLTNPVYAVAEPGAHAEN